MNADSTAPAQDIEPDPAIWPEAGSRWAEDYRAEDADQQPVATLADQIAARVCRRLGI
ncbi:hypothetical protein [Saccharopolyspora sp. NPDC002376]